MDFLLFDYLRYLDIPYKTEGKNIGVGWVGIRNCPNCGDSRYHLGINTESGNFSCWVCGETGNLTKLIKLLEGIPYREAKQRIKEYTTVSMELPDTWFTHKITQHLFSNGERATHVLLPEGLMRIDEAINIFPACKNYLNNRGFTYEDVKEWDAYYSMHGKYSMRILFPIRQNGELVTYTTRAVVPTEKRHLHCPKNESVIPLHKCLYNYDKITQRMPVIIVEGIFDALKIIKLLTKNVIALLGKAMSAEQKLLLRYKNPEKVTICLDKDAWATGLKLAMELKFMLQCPVSSVTTNKKDPADYNSRTELAGVLYKK